MSRCIECKCCAKIPTVELETGTESCIHYCSNFSCIKDTNGLLVITRPCRFNNCKNFINKK